MKVSDVAELARVTPHAVRHYVRVGLIRPAQDPRNRYRRFNPRDVRRVLFIKRAQSLGFTLDDVRMIFRDSERGTSPCPLVRRIIAERLLQHEREIDEMLALRNRMREAVTNWQRLADHVPTGDEICALIEEAPVSTPPNRSRRAPARSEVSSGTHSRHARVVEKGAGR